MAKVDKPEIGAEMYAVFEHLYSNKSACLLFTGPHGFPQPGYYKLDDIGKKLFYTAAEAATLAKSMTEKYERIWGWIGAPEFPMARPWEDLLERKDDSTLDMEIEGRG